MSRGVSEEAYEEEEFGDSVSCAASILGRRRRGGSARGSGGAGDDSYVCNCWLCGRARATDEDVVGNVARHAVLERHPLSHQIASRLCFQDQ